MELELFFPSVSFLLFLLSKSSPPGDGSDPDAGRRWEMVENQIISRGIRDSSVIQAMLKVPRQEFVPREHRQAAYNDNPVPIGRGVTVSQPYIVALMTELLRPVPGMKVLEVGTGSGYQSAVLVETGCELYTIEILEDIAERARKILDDLGYSGIRYKIGDGYEGWEEHAPFDGIIVTAAPGHIPRKLVEQLKPYGRIIIPVGEENQELLLIEKTEEGIVTKRITSVRFVPMTGEPEKE
ncbi:MAG: protein-L-isoaspartate(D-aspartate) O-methyltransferase [Deltaproteobacteria bacterium]